jgi:hypothetical protein
MYRIETAIDGLVHLVYLDEEINFAKFIFWLRANDYLIISIQNLGDAKIKNSFVSSWIVEQFKKEEKFKGD